MFTDLSSDYPAYIFMAIFAAFVAFVIIKGNSKTQEKTEPIKQQVIEQHKEGPSKFNKKNKKFKK
jgi:hypothetical protein